jgi:hypothetical protein
MMVSVQNIAAAKAHKRLIQKTERMSHVGSATPL